MNQGVGVLGTVRDSCKIHPMVHDYRMTEAIENLSDLITDQGNGSDFFARNHITQGMDALFREVCCVLRVYPIKPPSNWPRPWAAARRT
jgi:hypothetical protein